MRMTAMRKWLGAMALVAVGLGGVAGCKSAAPKQKAPERAVPAGKITFEDAVKIDNGVVRLAVSPSVGRVVEFGYVGQPNLVWINTQDIYDTPPGPDTYYNIGGDKLWVAPQALWKSAVGHDAWPPEGVIDGAAWTLVEQKRDSITIQSAESPDYGVVVRRTFRLPPSTSQAVITNQVVRLRANPHPLQLWTVTQVTEPDAAVLDIAKDGPEMPSTFISMTDETPEKIKGHVRLIGEGGAVEWTQTGGTPAKLGTLGRWVAGVYDSVVFRQSTKFDPNAAYPEASSVQVYRADQYIELELLSPLIQLAPGESMSNTVTWALIEVSKQYDPTEFLLTSDPK